MKTCRICNRNLDDILFPKNGNALRNVCKECQTKRVRAKQLEFVNCTIFENRMFYMWV